MRDYNRDAGRMLRTLRQQRGLTLKQAASRLQTSAPVLSRKERGQDAIERQDIQLAIVVYQLDPWEGYALWVVAGFMPEQAPPNSSADLHTVAEMLLTNLLFPAFINDGLGYLHAWNQPIETLWAPSQTGTARIHLLDCLFSTYVRNKLGELWASCIGHALHVFHHKTMHMAGEPEFHALIYALATKYGEVFIAKWHEARQNNNTPMATDGLIVQCASPVGPIDYLVLQTTFQTSPPNELIVYMPWGAENQARDEQFRSQLGVNRVYFSSELSLAT